MDIAHTGYHSDTSASDSEGEGEEARNNANNLSANLNNAVTAYSWRGWKNRGKNAFRRGDYASALQAYSQAYKKRDQRDLSSIETFVAGCPSTLDQQKILSDTVACRLRMKGLFQAEAALVTAKRCVSLDEGWAGGHIRMAESYLAVMEILLSALKAQNPPAFRAGVDGGSKTDGNGGAGGSAGGNVSGDTSCNIEHDHEYDGDDDNDSDDDDDDDNDSLDGSVADTSSNTDRGNDGHDGTDNSIIAETVDDNRLSTVRNCVDAHVVNTNDRGTGNSTTDDNDSVGIVRGEDENDNVHIHANDSADDSADGNFDENSDANAWVNGNADRTSTAADEESNNNYLRIKECWKGAKTAILKVGELDPENRAFQSLVTRDGRDSEIAAPKNELFSVVSSKVFANVRSVVDIEKDGDDDQRNSAIIPKWHDRIAFKAHRFAAWYLALDVNDQKLFLLFVFFVSTYIPAKYYSDEPWYEGFFLSPGRYKKY